ncbi:Methionine aminopeptidase 1 [Komagataella phaffii]|uniref:Methionine aminopeptidase n=2 Tax=Komagataella phaffii TaxID=460519 RepID=C4R4E8_KOMPG|nr:Methionine aminopeptidase [Komagataella phaffii GS115]CAY70434.1 Methionine aminopeptidase [Komagataella phaffii GS115]
MIHSCASAECSKATESTLKCPLCLKQGQIQYFCNQKCFKNGWKIHKAVHAKDGDIDGSYNPFPNFAYTGELRPAYPLSVRREVPENITLPDYALDGVPVSEIKNNRMNKINLVTEPEDLAKLKNVCRLAREVLDAAAASIKPGVTTDEIDEIVHSETIKREAYPSPLNYFNFPKSVCTSVNEVICHGIPDRRPLQDGDIVNLDVTLYKDGFHADLNETYYVGEKAKTNKDLVNLVETTREALAEAIRLVKPGMPFRQIGTVIENYVTERGCETVRSYTGHGINTLFHTEPTIPHYARNKAVGVAKPGVVFTIEPMLTLGTHRDVVWPDNWTAVTADGGPSAQFEHTLLVTEDGVEILTGRTETSPGGAISRL